MSEITECVVIGAGVIGLSIARELAMAGHEVIILETAHSIGTETSSRNSEVIHAGIYYPRDSLKAKLCLEGKKKLYEYCRSHNVPHKTCGKLIVATNKEEIPVLEKIIRQAQENGVTDLYKIDEKRTSMLEPELKCTEAIVSPSTGIIDSHSLMLAYQGEAEDHGAMIAYHSKVVSGEISPRKFSIEVDINDGETIKLCCNKMIIAGGLNSQKIARNLDGFPRSKIPPSYLCKGSYFALQGKAPFSRLIYPVPNSASLGVHVTLDMGGQVRFGPDQEWVPKVDYDVDPDRASQFYESVRRYYPKLKQGALIPAYAGVRPKIQGPKEATKDFCIQGPKEHGIDGLIALYGIESPGLTASLAIAREVTQILCDDY